MINFTKMHGIGNDFVMVNGFEHKLPEHDLRELAQEMCSRRFGIGSDGLIIAIPGESEKFRMRMLNPDGSESEMCGNGIRCLAEFLVDEKLTNEETIPVETGAGLLVLQRQGKNQVRVDMGLARLAPHEIGMNAEGDQWVNQPIEVLGESFMGTAVSMGNPHLVIFVDDVHTVPLDKWGPALETHPLFPKRVNVHFVQVDSRTHLTQRTWERGAGATLACGTGACSVGVAAFLNGKSEREVTITLPGGDLQIEYTEEGRVYMTGPAVTAFRGVWHN